MVNFAPSMQYLLSLGSNIGDRLKNLSDAVYLIGCRCGRVLNASAIYQTPPWGFTADQPFYNQVLLLDSELEPHSLLAQLLAIEIELGRTRVEGAVGYTSRTIDLDMLMAGDTVIHTEGLELPHPRFHERAFVLIPACEIASEWCHPITGATIGELAGMHKMPVDMIRLP
ncbi:MAG: 2-amino-4-hydroxy-6-hydroxymethyldihydropteridine diphosphokinase [Cryomorphaceae bacterium]|nr:MAG: 2-amino-4-hydroxy-6-hydroxymethyldihydropteridine diphosphokinase [Cryomorphaceae bacterium]